MALVAIPISDTSELIDFYCGLDIMDNFIHSADGLLASIQNHYCKCFVVKDDNSHILAMFALAFDSISFDEDDIEDLFSGVLSSTPNITEGYKDNFTSKSHHPALDITYLAVDRKHQHQGIGSKIISAIIDMAKEQSIAGCEFLAVDAYFDKNYNASVFYSKCQFNILTLPSSITHTTRMYRLLYPKES